MTEVVAEYTGEKYLDYDQSIYRQPPFDQLTADLSDQFGVSREFIEPFLSRLPYLCDKNPHLFGDPEILNWQDLSKRMTNFSTSSSLWVGHLRPTVAGWPKEKKGSAAEVLKNFGSRLAAVPYWFDYFLCFSGSYIWETGLIRGKVSREIFEANPTDSYLFWASKQKPWREADVTWGIVEIFGSKLEGISVEEATGKTGGSRGSHRNTWRVTKTLKEMRK